MERIDVRIQSLAALMVARQLLPPISRPELSCACIQHAGGAQSRHGSRLIRWRSDKAPQDCTMDNWKSRPVHTALEAHPKGNKLPGSVLGRVKMRVFSRNCSGVTVGGLQRFSHRAGLTGGHARSCDWD